MARPSVMLCVKSALEVGEARLSVMRPVKQG